MDHRIPDSVTDSTFLYRRSHRKSKSGCVTCKKRRVKCDENKPKCRNCDRRRLECHFPPSTTAQAPLIDDLLQDAALLNWHKSDHTTIPTANTNAEQQHQNTSHGTEGSSSNLAETFPALFDLLDIKLFSHYTRVVSRTLADSSESLHLWKYRIPEIAFENAEVMRLILAISAVHIEQNTQNDPVQNREMWIKADEHYGMSLRPMMVAMDRFEKQDAEALWISSMLLVFYNLGRGPSSGQYLLFGESREPVFLSLVRGVRAILEKAVRSGISPFENNSSDRSKNVTEDPVRLEPKTKPLPYPKSLQGLRWHIERLILENASFQIYLDVLGRLESCYANAWEDPDDPEGSKLRHYIIFSWLYLVDDEYITALQAKKPLALVIFAHFLPLLAQLRDRWYMTRWVEHVMNAIDRHLHPAYKEWMKWPEDVLAINVPATDVPVTNVDGNVASPQDWVMVSGDLPADKDMSLPSRLRSNGTRPPSA